MKNWKAESNLYLKTPRKIILKTGLSIAYMLDNFSQTAIYTKIQKQNIQWGVTQGGGAYAPPVGAPAGEDEVTTQGRLFIPYFQNRPMNDILPFPHLRESSGWVSQIQPFFDYRLHEWKIVEIAISVAALVPECEQTARHWARRLGLPFGEHGDYQLQLGPDGLQLACLDPGAPGPVRVDFVRGATAYRRQSGGGKGQMIARAVGVLPGVRPRILDAAAGLGRDAFVLAGLGCELILIERHPLLAALLEDGLRRALDDADTAPIAARMRLREGDAIALMRGWRGEAPQVVYLDPMFPPRNKSALVKKEMRVFRPLVGDDDDAPALLAEALSLASHRVVVKRPRQALTLGGIAPGYALEGKSSRFDIYPKRSLKEKGGA
jgi:16S rRNA (guanine1516-N2)-methyltransferase